MHRTIYMRLAAACLLPILCAGPAAAQRPPAAAAHPVEAHPAPGTIQAIRIVGNRRIDASTIRSYMLVRPGDPFNPQVLDRSLKTLYATGLFQDVRLERQGSTLLVHVVENPSVNQVFFDGNHELTDAQLRKVIQIRPRAVFTPALAEDDRHRILEAYAKHGYYDATVRPEIIRLQENRVNVVFEINDGPSTLISKISFVGNHAFGSGRLSEVIDSREERWWRFLSSSDHYDPQRLAFDKELLRRFYLKKGYVDFHVLDAKAELAPDRRSFFLTFTIHEGPRYRVAKITISSHLRHLFGNELRKDLKLEAGDWYDGDAVGRTVDAMEADVHNRGYAFVQVKPEVRKVPGKHAVDLAFDVGQGPRVYVERINIVGNTRTEDRVIRREFRLAEGDPYSASLVRQSRQRLLDLGFFNSVNIKTTPGSAPDQAILTTDVSEKATGQLTLGGGYSTDAGALIDVGLGEKNLVGTGIAANVNGVLAQRNTSISGSVTDPYFLGRNLIAGTDVFLIQTNFLGTEPYDERRDGFDVRLGYNFNDHLRQVWTYSLVDRTVYNISTYASPFILDEAGSTLLSEISQQLSLDYRDSKQDPHSGYLVQLGTDLAGLGGNARFIRTSLNASYYIPLDRFTGNSAWDIKLSAGAGYLFTLGHPEQIIDRFFLGGDNLRGFQTGGAGPHDAISGDPLGGRFIWTQSTELRFPLPVSPDLGLSGLAFVDVGGLTDSSFGSSSFGSQGCREYNGQACQIVDSGAPRVGMGVGISWRTAFGLINIDVTPFVIKQPYDQTQLFRFGFGTRF